VGCWRQIGRWLDEHRPDVLHIQYQAAAFDLGGWVNWLPWWLRRRQIRPRMVVTFHDLRVPYIFPKAGRLRWLSILTLARYCDAVIVTNVEDEQRLRRVVGRRESGGAGEQGSRGAGEQGSRGAGERGSKGARERGSDQAANGLIGKAGGPWLARIPLGSNVDVQPPPGYVREEWRVRLGIGGQTLVLAYFGFLNESKGGEELVLALERLVGQGYDARLLMIGGQVGDVDPTNQAYAERVRGLIRTHGLAERVHWTGYTSAEEVSANLLAADVIVMPYRDGASFRRTTFIAALSHGRPVVTTHPAVPLAELRDGENALLVPARDVAALVDAIARLAQDEQLQARLSAGAEALGREFDWPAITRQTLDLYRGLGLE
jgi:glycosyltransferase involved in cell wall biosynthesis